MTADDWTVGQAAQNDLEGVRAVYRRAGYNGGIAPADRVYVAHDVSGSVVGAARLCEEHETLVLRGMYVDAAYQRKGVGRALLEHLDKAIGAERCWCIPYTHLVPFYSLAGFAEVDPAVLPRFLAERVDRYSSAGHDVTVMKRPAPSGGT